MLKSNTILLLVLFYSFTTIAQSIKVEKIELSDTIKEINCIASEDSIVWVGTNKGLLKITDSGITRYYDEENPAKFTVNKIAIDSENGIRWLGTYRSSIIKFKNSIKDEEIFFTELTNNEPQLITSLTVRKNRVLIATSEGLLLNYDTKKQSKDTIISPINSEIYSLFIDNTFTKWICTSSGLYHSSVKKWKREKELLQAYQVYDNETDYWVIGRDKNNHTIIMFRDNQEFLVFGFKMKKQKWTKILIGGIEDLYTRYTDMDFDPKDNIWLATSNGVVKYNPNKDIYTPINQKKYPELKDKAIQTISVQNSKTIWAGSVGNNLYKIKIR